MATRSKSRNSGLLHAPSRKSYHPFDNKTGDEVKFQERREALVFSTQLSGGGPFTLYTCPVGKRSKVVGYSLACLNMNGVVGAITLNGTIISAVASNGTFPSEDSYEDAPQVSSGQSVEATWTDLTGAGTGVVIYMIRVIEEEAAGGYLTTGQ